MAFDRQYLTPMGYGGKGGNTVWLYYDANADNVASLAGTTPSTAYFQRAVDDHGIKARAGDVMIISSVATAATNTATPCLGLIPNDWDSNGATVMIAQPRFS